MYTDSGVLFWRSNRAAFALQHLVVVLLLSFTTNFVSAHGYIDIARGKLCSTAKNTNCGPIQYEPQSLEGLDGFPAAGPVDGQIASAGLAQFSQLNEQSSSRWYKTSIDAGENVFTWRFTANHVTSQWRYYITQPGWDPNDTLDREDFELTAFCSFNGNSSRPPTPLRHVCNVPADRSGYHIILAVWEVGDTANSFYNVIDVVIGDSVPPAVEWKRIGTINAALDLRAGDAVRVRLFDEQGERPELELAYNVESDDDGKKDIWPYRVARLLNAEGGNIRAGELDNGQVVPVFGTNAIFTDDDSDIVRAEVSIVSTPVDDLSLGVTDLQDAYSLANVRVGGFHGDDQRQCHGDRALERQRGTECRTRNRSRRWGYAPRVECRRIGRR